MSFPWDLQVEKSDVIEAFRLLEVAMQQSATDHSTGNLCNSVFQRYRICLKTRWVINMLFLFFNNVIIIECNNWISLNRYHWYGSHYNWGFCKWKNEKGELGIDHPQYNYGENATWRPVDSRVGGLSWQNINRFFLAFKCSCFYLIVENSICHTIGINVHVTANKSPYTLPKWP